jgi:hypothetical protein
MTSSRKMWTAALKSQGSAPRAEVGQHGNRITHVNGYRFASRLEADRYRELLLLHKAGEVRWFIRQVPFDVAPGVVYRCDFLVVWNRTGTAEDCVSIEDTKGHLTQTSRTKIAVVQERYGVRVRILTREQVSRT